MRAVVFAALCVVTLGSAAGCNSTGTPPPHPTYQYPPVSESGTFTAGPHRYHFRSEPETLPIDQKVIKITVIFQNFSERLLDAMDLEIRVTDASGTELQSPRPPEGPGVPEGLSWAGIDNRTSFPTTSQAAAMGPDDLRTHGHRDVRVLRPADEGSVTVEVLVDGSVEASWTTR